MAKRASPVRLIGCVALLGIAFWFSVCALLTPLGPWLARGAAGLMQGVANLPGIAWAREQAAGASSSTVETGTTNPSAAVKEALRAGLALQKEGKLQAALERYREALNLDQAYAPTHAALASLYHDLGQDDQALQELERAAELDPSNGYIHAQLGQFYLHRERYEEAVAALERATGALPEDAEVHSLLGAACYYRAHEDLNRAVSALEKSVELAPDQAQTHLRLAMAFVRRDEEGDVERAIASLERAVSLDPQQTEAYYYLGQLYSRNGDTRKAAAVWQHYVEVGQDSEAVARVRAWLESLEKGSDD